MSFIPWGKSTMEQHEQERFDQLYAKHLQALKLQGKRSKTIDGYARAVRRIAGFFNRCPDNLSATELKTYFAWMVENYSWSSVKVDLWGLSFFYRHVLGQPMDWVDIIKPPKSRSLPDIPTREEVQLLINSVYRLRYRVYFFVVYSMGLRLGEGLCLEVGDIDAANRRVHVRQGKGGKDRYVPLPDATLAVLRRFWSTHRNPRLLFPNGSGNDASARTARSPMDRGGVQAAMTAARQSCRIHKHFTIRSLRHAYVTHLLELGVDLRSIQVVLGHESPETTARYAHLTTVNRKQANDRIECLVADFALRWEDGQ
jgi:site-specific recombinase XerD